jgi:predicted metal-dependent hydrolase
VRKGKNNYLQLWVRANTTVPNKAKVLHAFYRQQLVKEVPKLLEKWLPRMGVQLQDWRIKQMKTKWGSCNIEASRLWLNLELAKKPYACLEYVLVHELVHLLERNHNERFMAFMDHFLPDWRERRELLNRMPLDAG